MSKYPNKLVVEMFPRQDDSFWVLEPDFHGAAKLENDVHETRVVIRSDDTVYFLILMKPLLRVFSSVASKRRGLTEVVR